MKMASGNRYVVEKHGQHFAVYDLAETQDGLVGKPFDTREQAEQKAARLNSTRAMRRKART
jgi:hypothetical protein